MFDVDVVFAPRRVLAPMASAKQASRRRDADARDVKCGARDESFTHGDKARGPWGVDEKMNSELSRHFMSRPTLCSALRSVQLMCVENRRHNAM